MRKAIGLLITSTCLLADLLHDSSRPATAQLRVPSPIELSRPDFPEVPPSRPQPNPLLLPPSLPSAPSLLEPDATSETVIVNEFRVEGSTVFTDAELTEAVAPFQNRPLTFSQLLEARDAITKLYLEQGYVTSGAVLPADQVIDQGIVMLQVVEGSVADIQVQGNRRLRTSYIRDRLALATQTPFNADQLLEALQLLQLNPLIAEISADLTPAPQPGTNVLLVTMREANPQRLTLNLNNGRPNSIGSFQRQLQWEHLNLTGNGDRASLSYANTDGSNEVGVSYEFPINPRNGTLQANFNQVWSRVISEPFDRLDLNGTSRLLELAYRQPVLQSDRQELALGIKLERRESETTLLDGRFPISPGADANGRTQITEVNLFQEWVTRSRSDVFALRSDFALGVDAFATVNPEPPDGRYFLWRGQAQWVHQVVPETLVLLRSNLQLADRPLVPLVQFGLGGLESVRGYPQDELLVDNGLLLTGEARIPIFRTGDRNGVLHIVPFLDYGYGWNQRHRVVDGSNHLFAAGLGLRWQWSDRINARIHWGVPILSTDDQSAGFDDSQIFFAVETNLF
jgi:hemolysin activation/secretion protein